MLEALLEAQGWEEEQVDDAALLVTEIVQNAVEHGSRADGTEAVEVRLRLEASAVEMECVDPGSRGRATDVVLRDVTRPVPLDQARGRGLFLIHRLATTLMREVDAGGGLRIRVRLELGEP
jgi:anti-sigma regulatory factor (Ser/Thr protein kinase)